MSDVSISRTEAARVTAAVKRKFASLDSEGFNMHNWNSNPLNYARLAESILAVTGKEVGIRFLRSFIFETSKLRDSETSNFRLSNVDALYLYVNGVVRNASLAESGTLSVEGRRLMMFVGKQKKNWPLDELLAEAASIDEWSLEDVIKIASDHNNLVYFFIDQELLQHKKACSWLLTFFFKDSYRFYIDLGILFCLSEDVKKASLEIPAESSDKFDIFTDKGRLNVLNYWRGILAKLKETFGSTQAYDFKEYEELAGIEFFVTLRAIAELDGINWLRKRGGANPFNSVSQFQPFFRQQKGLETIPFHDLYLQSVEEADRDKVQFAFYCVIGFEAYLDKKEQLQMIRYFYMFGHELKKHLKIRLFMLPCSISESGEFSSTLSNDQNFLLYQYLLVNRRVETRTYVLMYDRSQADHNTLYFYQDYVIRLQNHSGDKIDPLITIDRLAVGDDQIERDRYKRLYLAYPEKTSNGANQMIVLGAKENDYDNRDILRFLDDFRDRIKYLDPYSNDTQIQVLPFYESEDSPKRPGVIMKALGIENEVASVAESQLESFIKRIPTRTT